MITLLYAAILGLLSVLLANQVLYVRLRGGEEEKWRPNATERAQANFVENVPLALIILFIFHSLSDFAFKKRILKSNTKTIQM